MSVGTCHTQPVNELRVGQRGVVVRVGGKGPARRRMMDTGLVPGSEVKVVRVAPLGDPIKFVSPKPGDPSPCRSI
jgi:ferrous iron transport protein A